MHLGKKLFWLQGLSELTGRLNTATGCTATIEFHVGPKCGSRINADRFPNISYEKSDRFLQNGGNWYGSTPRTIYKCPLTIQNTKIFQGKLLNFNPLVNDNLS